MRFDKLQGAVVRQLKHVLRYPADALVLSSEALPRRVEDCLSRTSAIMENAGLGAKFYPNEPGAASFVLREPVENDATRGDHSLPVPPPHLWEGYGDTVEEYLSGGFEDFANMNGILSESGFDLEGKKVLDFGCSAGRLIRHLYGLVREDDVRGVDISGRHIEWCRTYLSPPFRFTTTTTYPNLPFEDNTFDLIYSASVFTHIADLGDAWLLELRRILRPGGRLYITVHDEHTIEVLQRQFPGHYLTQLLLDYEREAHFIGTRYRMVSLKRSPQAAMVFYHRDYLSAYWGRELTLLSITPEAYGFQSAVLLTK